MSIKKIICLLFHRWTHIKSNEFHGAYKYCSICDPFAEDKKYK